MKKNKGFTLAEMLIVVAIIGILVTIMTIAFSNSLERTREATDLANLRTAITNLQEAYIANEIPHKINKGLIENQIYYDKYSSDGSEYYFTYVIAKQKKWGWTISNNDAKTSISGVLTSASIYCWNARIRLNGENAGEVIITGTTEEGGKKIRAANGID